MMARRLILICMVLLLGMAALSPSPAQAQGQTPAQKEREDKRENLENQTTSCVNPADDEEVAGIKGIDWKKKYTSRLVYCMRDVLEKAAKDFLQIVITGFVLPTLGPIIIFAMALFGIKVTLGMFRGSPKAEAANFLFKVGVIAGLLGMGTLETGPDSHASDILVDFWFDTTDMLLEVVAAGSAKIFGSTSYCPSKVANIGNWIAIFDRFDCLFAKLSGFGKNVMRASGIIAIASAALMSGWLGAGFSFIALAALYIMAQFLFRAAMMVVLSYGGLALMIMVFPVFLPLLLFKRTEDFFYRGWLSLSIGFVIQPALTVAFLFFAISVMDDYLINGSKITYVRYNYTTNSTEVKNFVPGAQVPKGYISAHEPWHKVLGLPLDGTMTEQAVAIKRFMVPQRSGSLPLMQSDPANTGYMDNMNCGRYGLQNLSGDDVLKEAAKDDKAVALCTDKTKCKNALNNDNGLSNAPSQTTKIRTKDILCNQGRNLSPLTTSQNARGGNALDLSLRTIGFNLNFQNTPTGVLPTNQTPSLQDLSNTRMMRLIGSMGTIIILAGSCLVFMKNVPGMVQRIAGGPSMSLSSPYVGDKKLSDRIQTGLMKGKDGWMSSLSKGSNGKRGSMLDRLGGGAIKGFAKGFVTGDKSF